MPFAGQQPGGRVKTDPAGAGQVDFGPGVQVGEIDLGAAGTVDALLVGRELDQVAGHKAGRQAEILHDLDQQPRTVPARPGPEGQRLLWRLDARFHPDDVANVLLESLVERHHEVDRLHLVARHAGDPFLELGTDFRRLHVGAQFPLKPGLVFKRPLLRAGLQEEVERVDDRDLGDEIDLDRQEVGLPGRRTVPDSWTAGPAASSGSAA